MIKHLLVLLTLGCCISCADSDNEPSTDYTDARLKLARTYEQYAKTGYSQLASNTQFLLTAVSDFAQQPDAESLQSARQRLHDSRTSWQSVAPLQFGPAEDVLIRSSLNTYPADSDKIELNIANADYTLGTPTNIGAEGFAAIEYLLFGQNMTEQQVIDRYLDAQSGNRGDYLLAIATQANTLAANVSEAWNNSYGEQFTSDGALGTDVGSSLSLVVNAYEFHLQRFLRDGKIGIPAGVRSAGVPRPTATEAYFSGRSVEYLLYALEQMQLIYTGDSSAEGYGLQDYLEDLNFEDLASEIDAQFDQVIVKAQTLEDPLSDQINTDNEAVLDVFLELQKLVPMIKSDLASAMGVIITNQDADGD